jgi:hypothetical protein
MCCHYLIFLFIRIIIAIDMPLGLKFISAIELNGCKKKAPRPSVRLQNCYFSNKIIYKNGIMKISPFRQNQDNVRKKARPVYEAGPDIPDCLEGYPGQSMAAAWLFLSL